MVLGRPARNRSARVRCDHNRSAIEKTVPAPRAWQLPRSGNKGDGTFEDVSGRYGVNMGRWAWSCDFVDLHNDGRQDIYVQNGYISGRRA
ncbi:MAG: VCBS repeat-containing protein [Bryobacterales bacterium]